MMRMSNIIKKAMLQKFVTQPLVANQLQLSIMNATMISSGLNVNMENGAAVNRDGSVLDYCRLHNITIQPWSPFQYGFFEGVFLDNAKFPELNRMIDEIATYYNVSNTTIAMAWLLRHPARMQPVTGTTNLQRLRIAARQVKVHFLARNGTVFSAQQEMCFPKYKAAAFKG